MKRDAMTRGSGQIYQEVRLQGRVTGGRDDDLYDCPEARWRLMPTSELLQEIKRFFVATRQLGKCGEET